MNLNNLHKVFYSNIDIRWCSSITVNNFNKPKSGSYNSGYVDIAIISNSFAHLLFFRFLF
jgi:hypothetical protein